MKNYIQTIRSKLGHDLFIHPAARILVENEVGHFLTIIKVKTGQLGLPAGALEFHETIEACIKREVREETGLTLNSVQLIGLSSSPVNEKVHYPNGDQIQYFTTEFYSKDWSGTLQVQDLTEVKKAQFVPFERLQEIPAIEQNILESWQHFQGTGQPLVR
ncbi:MAG: NUDIX domain-containing protein [Bacteroidota bacterium]